MQLQVKSLIVPVWKPAKGQITRNWGAMRTPISCAPVVSSCAAAAQWAGAWCRTATQPQEAHLSKIRV